MDEAFIRQRITQLRIQKNVSEYRMSMDLGNSKGYIQSISSGRALPSMSEFLNICEYFDITPIEFFDENYREKTMTSKLQDELETLKQNDLELLIQLVKRLKQK